MIPSSERVAVSGLLTVGTVMAGGAALMAAFERSDCIMVDISAETPADVAGVQLLHSARLYAAQKGKRMTLVSPAKGALLDVLQLGGFIDGEAQDTRRFWLGDGAE